MNRAGPRVLKEQEGASEEKGEWARMSSIMGARAIGDLVKTTLGPHGNDKMLQPIGDKGKVSFTNDGATILKSIPVDNPAAKILIDTSKTQDSEVGDGTTSVTVLAAELLAQASNLLDQKIHPQTIIAGFRLAVNAAKEALEKASIDNSSDPAAFKQDLLNIARTTLSSKILASYKDHFANLAVEAVLKLKGSTNLDAIQIVKKTGGTLQDSYLDDGFILDKKIGTGQPKRIENARILLANTKMDTDNIKIYGARVRVDSVQQLAEIEQAEREKMKAKVKSILAHDINCFINRQLIYNFPEQLFTEAGVMSIEHADFEGVERLALVLGADIASTFDNPEQTKLGYCKLIEEIVIGEDKAIRFSGVARGEACTIVLRGASQHILDEAERSLHDALCVLVNTTKNTRICYGGGCSEMAMAKAVDELALRVPGKKSLAVEAFARALRQIPAILSDNAGYDSNELVAQLRSLHFQHKEGVCTAGLDLEYGRVGDMAKLRITECLKSKMQVLISAHEAAEMILRVDDIIRCAPRKRTPHQH